jgi:hypothetical protein
MTTFDQVKIGGFFERNGNLWRKRSTRTAVIVKPDHLAGSWFYFGASETAITSDYVDLYVKKLEIKK